VFALFRQERGCEKCCPRTFHVHNTTRKKNKKWGVRCNSESLRERRYDDYLTVKTFVLDLNIKKKTKAEAEQEIIPIANPTNSVPVGQEKDYCGVAMRPTTMM
jgi:hypothetical protein